MAFFHGLWHFSELFSTYFPLYFPIGSYTVRKYIHSPLKRYITHVWNIIFSWKILGSKIFWAIFVILPYFWTFKKIYLWYFIGLFLCKSGKIIYRIGTIDILKQIVHRTLGNMPHALGPNVGLSHFFENFGFRIFFRFLTLLFLMRFHMLIYR